MDWVFHLLLSLFLMIVWLSLFATPELLHTLNLDVVVVIYGTAFIGMYIFYSWFCRRSPSECK